MAECKICGYQDGGLPKNWTNWQCSMCEADEGRTYLDYPPPEKESDIEFAEALEDGFLSAAVEPTSEILSARREKTSKILRYDKSMDGQVKKKF